jgi:hypothetical protein
MTTIGATTWSFPDAYLPALGPPGAPGQVGHESLCVLNVGHDDAHLVISLFFSDRPPRRGIAVTVAGERCRHLRFDRPEEIGGVEIPREVPYGIVVDSDRPVVVQHARLEVAQANMSFLSTTLHSHNFRP